jgi:hypothetical protein
MPIQPTIARKEPLSGALLHLAIFRIGKNECADAPWNISRDL